MAANPSERTRRRLSTAERREQLLSVGARLFSESPYDDVWIEQVAEIACVSRGLLYHYFPTKREFFAAVVERESERMLRMTAAVPGVSAREQLHANLDTFLEYVETHAHGWACSRSERHCRCHLMKYRPTTWWSWSIHSARRAARRAWSSQWYTV